jgi:hypothetical protein
MTELFLTDKHDRHPSEGWDPDEWAFFQNICVAIAFAFDGVIPACAEMT